MEFKQQAQQIAGELPGALKLTSETARCGGLQVYKNQTQAFGFEDHNHRITRPVVLVLAYRGKQGGHQGWFASAFVRIEHKPIAVGGLDVERFELRQRIVFLDLDVRVLFS